MNILNNNEEYKYKIKPIQQIRKVDEWTVPPTLEDKWKWCIENRKLFYKVINKYNSAEYKTSDDDLYELYLEAIDLMEKYNPERNVKLTTFVFRMLGNKYYQYKAKKISGELTLSMINRVQHVMKYKDKYFKDGNLDILAFKEKYNNQVSDKYARVIQEIANNGYNLKKMMDPLNTTGIMNKLQDTKTPIEEVIDHKIILQKVNYITECMPKRDKEIFDCYYGLNKYKNDPHTLTDVAKELHISTERVRQIKQRALLRVQRLFNKHILELRTRRNRLNGTI